MAEYKHAIVVGASSGIGAELAKLLAGRGCRVAAVARRKDRLEALAAQNSNILPFQHDVAAFDEAPPLFQEITRQLGGLDLFVYSAGVMPPVGISEFNFEKDRAMVETNLLGAIAWLNQAAIRFENTKRGSLVGIGSVAGDRGRAGQPVYNATKAALATYLEALRNRLCRHGVKVVTIKPGPVDTELIASLHLKNAMSAEDAAARILRKCDQTGEHYLKASHRLIFWTLKQIPSPIFRKLNL